MPADNRHEPLAQCGRVSAQRFETMPRILAPQARAQGFQPLLPGRDAGAQRESQALLQVVQPLRVLRELRARMRNLQSLRQGADGQRLGAQ